jgi:hypothetical protein
MVAAIGATRARINDRFSGRYAVDADVQEASDTKSEKKNDDADLE